MHPISCLLISMGVGDACWWQVGLGEGCEGFLYFSVWLEL